jgi:hypothetical protein
MASLCASLNVGLTPEAETLRFLAGELEWALSALAGQRARVAAFRNTLPHISSFPAEILAHVIRFAVQGTIKHPVQETPLDFAFAQVCRAWRDVAVASPVLWVVPLFRWPEFAELMVRRSKSMPLFVSSKIPSRPSIARQRQNLTALEAACRDMSRLRQLDLFGPGDVLGTFLSELVTSSSKPALQVLRLDMDYPDAVQWEGPPRGTLSAFLLGHWRVLGDYAIPEGICFCANLTELVITYSDRDYVKLSLVELLNVLGQTSALRDLHLSEVYDQRAFDSNTLPVSRRNPICLEHLGTIRLFGDLSLSVTLLDLLLLPAHVGIHLDNGGEYATQEDIELTFVFVGDHRSLKLGQPLHWLTIDMEDDHSLKIMGHQNYQSLIRFKVSCQWSEDDGITFGEDLFPGIAQVLPFEDVEFLTVKMDKLDQSPSGVRWANLFIRAENLSWVFLEEEAMIGFVSALEIIHRCVEPLPLPELEHMEIEHADMNVLIDAGMMGPADEPAARQRSALEVLAGTLLKRSDQSLGRRRGRSIKLLFKNCRVTLDAPLRERLRARDVTVVDKQTDGGRFWKRHDAELSFIDQYPSFA